MTSSGSIMISSPLATTCRAPSARQEDIPIEQALSTLCGLLTVDGCKLSGPLSGTCAVHHTGWRAVLHKSSPKYHRLHTLSSALPRPLRVFLTRNRLKVVPYVVALITKGTRYGVTCFVLFSAAPRATNSCRCSFCACRVHGMCQ